MAELTDILTGPEAQQAVNSTAAVTAELERAVSATSQAIDAACGPVVARSVTEVHPGGHGTIWLFEPPARSITSVTEFDGTTQTVLTDESAFGTVGGRLGFVLSPSGYAIDRRSGGRPSTFGHGQVQVVYSAGRFADTASVSPKFKQAAANILRRLWKREGSSWAYSPDYYANTDETAAQAGFFRAVQPMIDEWLWDERRAPVIA